jgi:hypothetical protein
MRKYFLFLLASALALPLCSQRAFKFYIPATMDVGLVLPRKISATTNTWSPNIGTAVNIRAGGSLLYKDRVGLRAELGALFFAANYFKKDASYGILTFMTNVSATPYALFPLRNNDRFLHIGCQFGKIYYDYDELRATEPTFEVVSNSFRGRPLFYSPEIGLTRIDRKTTFTIVGTYFYQSFQDPLIVTKITDDSGEFIGTCKGDYPALRFSLAFHIGGKKEVQNPKPLFIDNPEESGDFASRDNAVIKQIKTGRKYIKLRLYESGEIDNDSISVSVNGRYILTQHSLEKKKVKLRIPLEKGTNTITVYAHNEGDLPPNTASCFIRYGFRKTTFPVSTSMKRNATVLIERK